MAPRTAGTQAALDGKRCQSGGENAAFVVFDLRVAGVMWAMPQGSHNILLEEEPQMKKTKVLLSLACAVMLVVTSVMGTMAYLTDHDKVTNTFTVGSVTLGGGQQAGLDEAKTNIDGKPVNKNGTEVALDAAPRVKANEYKLMPGHSYTKDPTVHVNNSSEECWVFVKVENGIAAYESTDTGYTKISDQITAKGWTALTGVENVYYKEHEKTVSDTGYTDYVVFSNFKIADNADSVSGWDTINTSKPTIVINAYAVQKDGFATAADAWNVVKDLGTTPAPAPTPDGSSSSAE